jgi:ADP-ribose pyrophosphatase YjhB (NUDIX family)
MAARHEFPDRPVPAVSAIVFRDGSVLLVKRRDEPSRGLWSPPGGSVELGETVEAAAARETLEETGVRVRPLRVVDLREVIQADPGGRWRWHYVLFAVLCEYLEGDPFPGSDAENACFLPLRELGEYEVTPTAREALERVAGTRPP